MTDLTEAVLIGIGTGLASNALWETGKWALKHRQVIAQTLRQPVVKSASLLAQSSSSVTIQLKKITATSNIGITDNVQPVLLSGTAQGTSSARGVLTVEYPTPSLTKRLTDEGIELVSWYLRQA